MDDILNGILLQGLDACNLAVCLCDDDDRIRYVNGMVQRAFCIGIDGGPGDFAQRLADATRRGRGIKLDGMNPEAFAVGVRTRRRNQIGSISFAADTVDGKWWWVTDTKLANGWLLAIGQEISSLKQQESMLRDAHAVAMEEAQTDVLTGAPNRRHGLRRADVVFARCRSNGARLTFALLDIDRFKRINDTFGHEVGDEALVHFAAQFLNGIGIRDQFSRIGGEEFLLLSTEEDPNYLVTRIRTILDRMPPLKIDEGDDVLQLTASVGLATASRHETMRSLMHRADGALFEAKAAGRACIRQAPDALS